MHSASAYAPANIALCKYWGKRDHKRNLPVNGSLSLSLGSLGTTTTIHAAAKDSIQLNGNPLSDNAFSQRIWTFVDLFVPERRQNIVIDTHNTIPIAAGLASSASGFAALTLALNRFFSKNLSPKALSVYARQGSGSACRSLWPGFVEWQRGEADDGSDCYAFPLPSDWTDVRLAVITISHQAKTISSRSGMNHTVATSPLYASWRQRVDNDLNGIRQAIAHKNFQCLGKISEANALMMHATMFAARPAVCYWQPQTLAILQQVWQARADGLALYATIDAGPNIKLLFQTQNASAVAEYFPGAEPINPWANATTA